MKSPKLSHRAKQKLYEVNEKGKITGRIIARKIAHSGEGIKHLAIGVLVFTANNEIVLHKRLNTKVGGGTIDYPVTHVLEGETAEEAAFRCLKNEYGIKEKIALIKLFGFSYEKVYGDGTCENEYLIIYRANYNGKIIPNLKEMEKDIFRVKFNELLRDIKENPYKYSVWFQRTIDHLNTKELLKD